MTQHGDETRSDDARDLLGAYALGAIDADEAEAVEHLLLEDQDARAELHALQLGSAWMASADPRPAPRVWSSIVAEIEHDELDAARRRRSRTRTRVFAVAAALVVAISVATAVLLRSGDDSQPAATGTVVALTDDAGATRLEMAMEPGEDGTGHVASSRLPRLTGETYQLWAISDDSIRSVRVLGRDPEGQQFTVPAGTERLAVTREPEGGSTRPTTSPIASGTVA